MVVDSARLPRWSWWLSLPLFHLATWLSFSTQLAGGMVLLHLPFALGLCAVLWWGPRALPAFYLNGLLSAPLWGLGWRLAPLLALPETLALACAWLALRRPGDAALADVPSLLRFTLRGVLAPALLAALGVQAVLLLGEHLEASQWREDTLGLWLQYCLSAQAVTLPLLCLLTERLRRRGWALGAASGERAEAAPPLWLLPLLLAALPLALGYLPLLLILPLIGAMLLV